MNPLILDAARAALPALSAGAEIADLFWENSVSDYVVAEDSSVEEASSSTLLGAGLRAVKKGDLRFAHLTAPSPVDILRLAEELRFSGRNRKTSWSEPVFAESPALRPPSSLTLSQKAALCLKAEKAARKAGKKIRQVRIALRDYTREILVAREDGVIVAMAESGVYFSALAVASDGNVTQTGYEAVGAGGGFELFNSAGPEEIALMAANRALAMLKAKKAPGGPMPVVLSSTAGGTMIHEAVGHGLEADLVSGGYSIYRGKTGKMVASPLVTVMDDPTLPKKRGSYLYDDEGTLASPTVLIENGILKGWLDSRLTSKRGGNGRRESYAHTPIPRMSNTFIAPGMANPEEILKATKRGLFVTRMGGGEVDTLSGNFVFEVSEGYIIEDGEKGEPVRGATLAGNGPRVLREIDMVGSDLGFAPGTCGKDGQGVPVSDAQPTIRIPELVVGGEAG